MAEPATAQSGAPSDSQAAPTRSVGLLGATGVGVGAIVGGGILVLAGVAFRATGPSALIAFAVNGVIAVLTALSFAEMSSSFPESGGAYTFAKKVLNVRSAFAVGWILWFAYIVAGVLYALGFASYAAVMAQNIWQASGGDAPAWLNTRTTVVALAIGATSIYTLSLIRKATGGGEWATWGKVVVFVVLILVGLWAIIFRDDVRVAKNLTPFFPSGTTGLLQAMGFTFIALQGFDLIAAIAGEVKSPGRVIPRAMLLSLGAAILIYLPLLFVVSTAGVSPGESIVSMSARDPETVMAVAVKNYMGVVGYWLVMIAAVLSTLSALHANLLAASRVALTMAGDRTLPTVLGQVHQARRTPVMAIYASALALVAILLMVPDLAAAGAAASLIFLIAFALAHLTTILARRRSEERMSQFLDKPPSMMAPSVVGPDLDDKPFRTPLFPLVPVVGGVACVVMAVFQGVSVPAAGGITAVWLGLGVLLYFALFSRRAQVFDASAEAADPKLVRLRGRSPLVLLPIANPRSAPAMVAIASALAPPRVGRVMLLSVMRPPPKASDDEPPPSLVDTSSVVKDAMTASFHAGHKPEALMTVASAPWNEIGRVARTHRCEGLLLGLSDVDHLEGGPLENLMQMVDCDVAFMSAPEGWDPKAALRIMVYVRPQAGHVELRARLIGSLDRVAPRESTWMTVIPADSSPAVETEARRNLTRLAQDTTRQEPRIEIVRSDDPVPPVLEASAEHDLLVLGLERKERGQRVFGDLALGVASGTKCATIMISEGDK